MHVLGPRFLAERLLPAMVGRERGRVLITSSISAQGFEALMAGKDCVIGGDRKLKLQGLLNRFLPDPFKAARHSRAARPATLPAWGRH